jgi:putative nucleotidyltransferase with HDIG domain
MTGYIKLRKKVISLLNEKLPEDLYYHGIHHTLDVLHVCNQYIRREKIGKHDAGLLRVAALFHDIGFIESMREHEKNGARIATQMMPEYGFSPEDVEKVQGLILATRIPQSPTNFLEKIICDADLDYLGRNDFYQISDLLGKELEVYGNIKSKLEWNKLQIRFLEAHRYHTDFAIRNRQPNKEKRIFELKEWVENSKK